MSKLEEGEGCCAGHRCDGCGRCLGGDCCGADVFEAVLRAEGSWQGGEAFGEVGVMEEVEGRIRCACCGEWFENLAQHVRLRHDLGADDYRSIWGLKCGQALMGERMRAARRRRAVGRAEIRNVAAGVTPEQRSVWSSGRYSRTQAVLAGQPVFTSAHQSRAAAARWARPGSRGANLMARRRRVGDAAVIMCLVCSVPYCHVPGSGHPRKSCGDAGCLSELKRRAAARRWA